jgi:hypothetical protein
MLYCQIYHMKKNFQKLRKKYISNVLYTQMKQKLIKNFTCKWISAAKNIFWIKKQDHKNYQNKNMNLYEYK